MKLICGKISGQISSGIAKAAAGDTYYPSVSELTLLLTVPGRGFI